MTIQSITFCCIFSLLFACGKKAETTENQAGAISAATEIEATNLGDDEAAKAFVEQWSAATSAGDLTTLQGLYQNSVLYYGKQLEKGKCLTDKQRFFAKHHDFQQEILGEITVVPIDAQNSQCFFTKRVTFGGKTQNYPAYLKLEKANNQYFIVTEGDEITDAAIEKRKNKAATNANEGEVLGDFNGDGKKETVKLIAPKIREEEMECVGECECRLVFSDASIPEIKLGSCIGGEPVNEGDLNEDGADELGLLPSWFTSCWHTYYVWAWKGKKWTDLAAVSTHCNQWDNGVDAVSKHPTKKGYIIVRSSFLDMEGDGGFKVIEKTIKVK